MRDNIPPDNSGDSGRPVPQVHVLLQPEEKHMDIPRCKAKTVAQLLSALGLRQGTALVARDGVLLTPDLPLLPGQTLLVRKVMSSG